MNAAIAIDEWKVEIYKRHLEQSGYAFEMRKGPILNCIFLYLQTDNREALEAVVLAADGEARKTGAPL